MNTRYYALTKEQRLSLTNEELLRAVKLEAVERGIPLPTTLSDILKQSDAKGFHVPPDATRLFELMSVSSSYGNPSGTGIAFLTEEAALRALDGALSIWEEGYGDKKQTKLADPTKLGIRQTYVTLRPPSSYFTKLETLNEDTEAFDALCEECRVDLETIRQDDYNRRVLQVQRAQYVELANGDEAVAAAFWVKTKGTAFPELDPSISQ